MNRHICKRYSRKGDCTGFSSGTSTLRLALVIEGNFIVDVNLKIRGNSTSKPRNLKTVFQKGINSIHQIPENICPQFRQNLDYTLTRCIMAIATAASTDHRQSSAERKFTLSTNLSRDP